jgi:chloramphenicol-sensitive protein RarD
MNSGVWAAIGAYVLWGLLPLYWKVLAHIPSQEILAHRMVWSLGFCGVLVAVTGVRKLQDAIRQRPRNLLIYTLTALLLAANWFTYIWATTHGRVLEASLGYFINPLFSVFLGVVLLGERPRKLQWIAIGIALTGVLWLTFIYGRLPVVALVLAVSFGFYGLIKKQAPLGSVDGLTLETLLLFVPALGYLLWLDARGAGHFGHSSTQDVLFLAGSGVVTALPLVLFAVGARRIPLNQLGFLQYIAPILQFSIGVIAFDERLQPNRFVGFSIIWLALMLYTFDTVRAGKRARRRRLDGMVSTG